MVTARVSSRISREGQLVAGPTGGRVFVASPDPFGALALPGRTPAVPLIVVGNVVRLREVAMKETEYRDQRERWKRNDLLIYTQNIIYT